MGNGATVGAVLANEHQTIGHLLSVLDRMAKDLGHGPPAEPSRVTQALGLLGRYGRGLHCAKEEGSLFPEVAADGMPGGGHLVAVLRSQHEAIAALAEAVQRASDDLSRGDDRARRPVARGVLVLTALVRRHMDFEESILFPHLRGTFPRAASVRVLATFRALDRASPLARAVDYEIRFLENGDGPAHQPAVTRRKRGTRAR